MKGSLFEDCSQISDIKNLPPFHKGLVHSHVILKWAPTSTFPLGVPLLLQSRKPLRSYGIIESRSGNGRFVLLTSWPPDLDCEAEDIKIQ